MGKRAKQIAVLSLAVVGALTLTVTIGLFMVGLEEIHLEAWKDWKKEGTEI